MRNAPTNYQLDQKSIQLPTLHILPIPSVRPVNMDGICWFWTLILIKRQKCPQLIKHNNKKFGLNLLIKNIKTNIFNKEKKIKKQKKKRKGKGSHPILGRRWLAATPHNLGWLASHPLFLFCFLFKLRAFRSFLKLSYGI
jgi:hypothetical protein